MAVKTLALMTLIPGVHLVNVSRIFAIVILYGAGHVSNDILDRAVERAGEILRA